MGKLSEFRTEADIEAQERRARARARRGKAPKVAQKSERFSHYLDRTVRYPQVRCACGALEKMVTEEQVVVWFEAHLADIRAAKRIAKRG